MLYVLQSLRRGRTVDRATSPIRKRDPSPDLQLLSFSVGCQASPEKVEPPKEMLSSFCQTDEEVIPPKILMSISSQTHVSIPVEQWLQQKRAAPQSPVPARVQSMAMPFIQDAASVQLQSPLAPNLFQAACNQSSLPYQMPMGMPSRQTYSLQSPQQGQSPGQAISITPIRTLQQHPTTVSHTAGLSPAGYLSGSINSQVPTIDLNRNPSMLVHRTTNNQAALTNANLNAYMSSFNPAAQSNAIAQSSMTNQTLASHQSMTQMNRAAPHVGRQLLSAQHTGPSLRTLLEPSDSRGALQPRITAAIQDKTIQDIRQRGISELQSSRNTSQPLGHFSSGGVAHQQQLLSLVSQPETQGHTQLHTQGNTLSLSNPSQSATLNSSTNQLPFTGGPSRPSVARTMTTSGHVQGRQVLWSHHQQGANLNSSANQSTVSTVQQPNSQPAAMNTQLHTQQNPVSVSINQQGMSLNSSTSQSAVIGVTMQQSVSQPLVRNTQLSTQRNPASLQQNQQRRNLNSPLSQTSVSGVAVQHSVQSNAVSASVQTRSSDSYNKTIKQFRQMAVERNLEVSKNQQRSDVIMYDEVRRVYNELQQSLLEVTLNKQKQGSASVGTYNSGVMRSAHVASNKSNSTFVSTSSDTLSSESISSQACYSKNTNLNICSPLDGFQRIVGSLQEQKQNGTAEEEVNHLSPQTDPYRRAPKTPSGALEDAVQRLLALQNDTSSSKSDFKCSTSDSVDELFDGTSEDENLTESLQPEQGTSDGVTVPLTETRTESEPLQEVGTVTRVAETSLSCDENEVLREKGMGDPLLSDAEELPEAASADVRLEDNIAGDQDSVFITPSTPSKTKGEIDKEKDTSTDDLYIHLMSPIIPQISTARRFRSPITQSVSHSDDFDNDVATVTDDDNGDRDNFVFNEDEDNTVQDTENTPRPTGAAEAVGSVKEAGNACTIAGTQQCVANMDSVDSENVENDPGIAQIAFAKERFVTDGDNVSEGETWHAVKVGDNAREGTETNHPEQSNLDTLQTGTNVSSVGTDVEKVPGFPPGLPETVKLVKDGELVDIDMETDSELEQSLAKSQEAMQNAENGPKFAPGAVDGGNADMATDAEPDLENVPEFAQGVLETKESVEKEDNAQEDMATDAEPDLVNVPEFAQGVLETKESVEKEDNADEDMETDAELEQSLANAQQAVANSEDTGPDAKNNDTVGLSAVQRKDYVIEGDKATEDISTDTEPKRRTADKEQCALRNSENYDPDVGTAFVQSAMEPERALKDGGNSKEGRRTDVGNKHRTADAQHAVISAEKFHRNDCEFVQSIMESKLSVEERDKDNEGLKTDREREHGTTETQQACLSVGNVGCDESAFGSGVSEKEESVESENNTDKDVETDQEPEQSIVGAQHTPVIGDDGDLDINSNSARKQIITGETGASVDNVKTESTAETERTAADTQHESGSLNSKQPFFGTDLDQQQNGGNAEGTEHISGDSSIMTLSSDVTVQDKENAPAPTNNGSFNITLDEIDQPVCNTSSAANHLSEERSNKAPTPSSHPTLELTSGPCLSGEGKLDLRTKSDHQNCGLVPKAIPKQVLYHLNSTDIQPPSLSDLSSVSEMNKICDTEGMKEYVLEKRQETEQMHIIPSSLVSRDVNGKEVSVFPVSRDMNVNQNEKENVLTIGPSEQHSNVASNLPKPRVAVRGLVNRDLVIMWDLPPDNKITGIEYFELYSWSRSGFWVPLAKIKALQLPMGCILKNLQSGTMFFFTVRAVGRNGVAGLFSQPSGIACL